MKKYRLLSTMALVMMLAACTDNKATKISQSSQTTTSSQKSSESASQTSSASESTSSSSSTQESSSSQTIEGSQDKQPQDDKIAYSSVFSDYQKILSSPASSNEAQVLQGLTHQEINPWVVRAALDFQSNQRYAFVDLDQDGKNELFTGSLNKDGTVYATSLYYLKDNKPTLLVQQFVGGTAARSGLTVYQGGSVSSYSWSSGTGQGWGSLYQLNKGAEATKVLDGEFDLQNGISSINTAFGKTDADIFNLDKLNWQAFETSPSSSSADTPTKTSSGMDVQAIANGDYSSIVGSWKAGDPKYGNMIFTTNSVQTTFENGSTGVPQFSGMKIEEQGHLVSGISYGSTGAVIAFVPAGVNVSSGQYVDASDTSRDRIWAVGHWQGSMEEPGSFYYLISE